MTGFPQRSRSRVLAGICGSRPCFPGEPLKAGDGPSDLTRTETFALTVIAYLQPVKGPALADQTPGIAPFR